MAPVYQVFSEDLGRIPAKVDEKLAFGQRCRASFLPEAQKP
jgi:hypothetical protein